MKTVYKDSEGNPIMQVTIENSDRIGMLAGGVKSIALGGPNGYQFAAGLSPGFYDPACANARIMEMVATSPAELFMKAPADAEFEIFDGMDAGTKKGTTEDIKTERLKWLLDEI